MHADLAVAESRFASRVFACLLVRGLVAFVFGVLVFARPSAGAEVLLYLFGAYTFVDGIFAFVAAYRVGHAGGTWWPMLVVGFCGVIIGLMCFTNPTTTALALVSYLGFWAVLTGLLQLIAACRLHHLVVGESVLGVSGLLGIAFGLLIAWRPDRGMVVIVWLVGGFALVFGALMVWLAFRVRGAARLLATA